MKVLLEKGALVDVKDNFGCTALYHTAFRGNDKFTSMLLDYKATTSLVNNDGHTVLAAAIKNGNYDTVKLLLPCFNTNFQDKYGSTHLFYAVCKLNLDIIGLLLDESPDVDIENIDGVSLAPLVLSLPK